jgi:hypothetical protein
MILIPTFRRLRQFNASLGKNLPQKFEINTVFNSLLLAERKYERHKKETNMNKAKFF